ncbi:hypothetical protein D3C81_1719070 [compost metagenome]
MALVRRGSGSHRRRVRRGVPAALVAHRAEQHLGQLRGRHATLAVQGGDATGGAELVLDGFQPGVERLEGRPQTGDVVVQVVADVRQREVQEPRAIIDHKSPVRSR